MKMGSTAKTDESPGPPRPLAASLMDLAHARWSSVNDAKEPVNESGEDR